VEALCVSPWPGNVRQLEVLARRLVATCGGRKLQYRDLPEGYLPSKKADLDASIPSESQLAASPLTRKRSELDRLTVAMKECQGNLSEAARRTGLSRMRAYRLIRELRSDVLDHQTRPPRGYRGEKSARRSES
jgi:transcriptional regulator of acetoin/glycerol metabolism